MATCVIASKQDAVMFFLLCLIIDQFLHASGNEKKIIAIFVFEMFGKILSIIKLILHIKIF